MASGRVELLDVDSDDDNLEAIRRAHSRMEALIDDTLTLARHGDPIGKTTAVPVADTARAAWSQVETPDARLEVDLDIELDADQSRLQQLFENLFRNAAEHGGAGVTVRVGELDDGAGFYVEDDGVGIPRTTVRRFSTTGSRRPPTGPGSASLSCNRLCTPTTGRLPSLRRSRGCPVRNPRRGPSRRALDGLSAPRPTSFPPRAYRGAFAGPLRRNSRAVGRAPHAFVAVLRRS
ncbi:sensor histidine kinase [Halomicroarcula sp. GCM10025710]